MITIEQILKSHNLPKIYAIVYFENDILIKPFQTYKRMTYIDKNLALESIRNSLLEGSIVLVIAEPNMFCMLDLDIMTNDNLEHVVLNNKIGVFADDSLTETFVYLFT